MKTKTFRRLTLPVDGSAASQRGVDFAAELAQSEGAEIDVCSALDDTAFMLPIAEGALVNPAPFIDAAQTATKNHISDALVQLHGAGITAEGTVLRGFPVAEIDEFARRRHADAIVMGTNGRSGIERMFMGSVTMALLRVADIPVVTVHADDTLRSGSILVAVDASPASLGALECAIARARVSGASLLLVHVFDESRIDRLIAATGLRPQGALRQGLTDAESALAQAADSVQAAGIPFTKQLERGVPADAILTVAERHEVGSIAIGTHGRSALERFIIGSVADSVVRRAHVPVYVVRRRDATAPKRAPDEQHAEHAPEPVSP
jgi:nucleotide-binding universal stress UspA family protein